MGAVGEILVIVVAAFILALLIQQFAFKPFIIPSDSMVPTLVEGDRVLVNRMVYRFGEPRKGDVVVFRSPIGSEDFIKRIVAVGGDTVEVKDGKLYVNGVVQNERYVYEAMIAGDFERVTVPAGEFFMMGDNRNNSGDSREFGSISEKAILGKAFIRYWPLTRLGGL